MLTQVALGNPEASDDEPPAKRLKDEPLQVADLRNHKDTMTKMLAWILKQKNHSMLQWRLNEKVREVHPTTEKSYVLAAKVTKLLISATLAVPTPNKTNSFDLVKVPQEDRDSTVIHLEKVGILKPGDKQKVTVQLGKRDTAAVFEECKFQECMALCAEGFKGHAE